MIGMTILALLLRFSEDAGQNVRKHFLYLNYLFISYHRRFGCPNPRSAGGSTLETVPRQSATVRMPDCDFSDRI